jgi:Transglycosylase SLT domain
MSIQKQMVEQLYGLAEKAQHPDQIKALQQQITKSIQDGAVPSYAAIPLVQELTDRLQKAQAMQQAPAAQTQGIQQPPIAEQVLAQAQGLDRLPSNLPAEAQAYAAGGIVAFAGGDLVDDDETETEDDRQESALMSLMSAARSKIQGLRASLPQSYEATLAAQKPTEQKPEGVKGFLGTLEHLESRGKDYDINGNILTSPKGAEGRMQVMRNTQRDPGFGVTPAKDKSPEELARVGRDYGLAMLERYGNEKDAAMAYNWGPGNMDRWIAGGRKGPVPGETRQYASNFAEGGIVGLAQGGAIKHFDGGGGIDAIGAELDALRSGTTTLEKAATAGGSRIPASQEVIDAYNYAKAQRDAKEKEYYDLLSKAGVDKPAFMPQYSMQPKRPVPNPTVTAMSAQPISTTSAPTSVSSAPTPNELQQFDQAQALWEAEQKANRPPATPISTTPSAVPPVIPGANPTVPQAPITEAVDPYLEKYMGMLQKRETDTEKQKELDAYLAVIQAGLGMMGGSSPYALQNIGQGGSQGVAAYAAAQKQRAAEEAATLSGYGKLYTAKETAGLRRDLAAESKDTAMARLAQDKELKQAKLKQDKELKVANDIRHLETQFATIAERNVKTALGTGFSDLDTDTKLKLIAEETRRLSSQSSNLKRLYTEAGLPEVDVVGPGAGPVPDYNTLYGLKPKK